LTDFGLSRKVDDDEPLKVFSHRWASPELFRNKKFTFETDIWAFGKLIFKKAMCSQQMKIWSNFTICLNKK